jgi:Transposase DDE domain
LAAERVGGGQFVVREEVPWRERDIQGLKYLEWLLPLLDRLHDVGCARDKAGNRKLHYDQYCLLVLLFLFNPVLRSLRSLQQASQLKKVQRKLGCPRTSLGSLSEAVDVFDPERLEGIIGDLLQQVPAGRSIGGEHVGQTLTAVDGSVIKTLACLAEAAYLRDKNGAAHSGWRFHTHFDIDRGIPTRMEVTSALNSGKSEEKNHLRGRLQSDHCYVMDRWYAEFALFNEIVDAHSSYVCRIRDNSNLSDVVEERAVSAAARTRGVLRDLVVNLGAHSKPQARPKHPIRVVLVETTPHKKRGGRKGGTAGPPSDGILRIATNLLDVPAEVIADIYRHRWAIELFFRFFKHVLGCRHLLSTDPVGIQIQAYCAIIACLLITLWTGGRPTLRSYEMICLYFMGWADLDELTEHLEKLKPARA